MEIRDILLQQKNILIEIKDTLIKEKEVLVKNDGRTLTILVDKKIDLMDALDKTEKTRISNFGEVPTSEMEIPVGVKNEVESLILEIKDIHKEIHGLQEINMMLTQQSIDYQNMMMHVVHKAIEKSGNVYSENGKMEGNAKIKTSIDKSV